jgi:hypothetical protein
MRAGVRLVLAALLASLGAACGMEPGAPLISLREPPATVLPSEVPPVRADDGFPVILADPATVAGLPRPPDEIAAVQASLESRGAVTEATAARVARAPSNVAALEERGRTHVEETRRRIEASGQPQTSEAPRDLPAAVATPRAPAAIPPAVAVAPEPAAAPLDPDAPAPRTVGGAPLVPVTTD